MNFLRVLNIFPNNRFNECRQYHDNFIYTTDIEMFVKKK